MELYIENSGLELYIENSRLELYIKNSTQELYIENSEMIIRRDHQFRWRQKIIEGCMKKEESWKRKEKKARTDSLKLKLDKTK